MWLVVLNDVCLLKRLILQGVRSVLITSELEVMQGVHSVF